MKRIILILIMVFAVGCDGGDSGDGEPIEIDHVRYDAFCGAKDWTYEGYDAYYCDEYIDNATSKLHSEIIKEQLRRWSMNCLDSEVINKFDITDDNQQMCAGRIWNNLMINDNTLIKLYDFKDASLGLCDEWVLRVKDYCI